MAITYADRLIDSGYYDITPEQEKEIEAREECERQGIYPDDICADGGVTAWMIVAQEIAMRPVSSMCSDCPPIGYPTDRTRCTPCPRKIGAA